MRVNGCSTTNQDKESIFQSQSHHKIITSIKSKGKTLTLKNKIHKQKQSHDFSGQATNQNQNQWSTEDVPYANVK